MLATVQPRGRQVAGFGRYNAVATACGSLGALAAAVPGLLRGWWQAAPGTSSYFLVFVPVALAGAIVAARLSPAVEAPSPVGHPPAARPATGRPRPVERSRPVVWRLCYLFAVDSL